MRLRFYLSLALSLASTGGASIVINPTFTDAEGVSWTPAMQNTVHQAISDWTSLLDHPSAQPISVDFTFMDSGFGLFTGSGSFAVGTDLYPWTPGMNHTISLNTDFQPLLL